MTDATIELNNPEYRKFVQNIIDNIKKNGFPEKKVSFSLEKMYEAAEKKGINLNKVLQTLQDIQICHEKTPDKIVFFPKLASTVETSSPPDKSPETGFDASMFSGIDPSIFAGVDPAIFEGMDLSNLKNLSLTQMMGFVGKMMKNMTPEQLKSIKGMYDNMSEEQKSSLLDKAKGLGMFSRADDTDTTDQ